MAADVPDDLESLVRRLEDVARRDGRSVEEVVFDAIERYLDGLESSFRRST